MGKALEVRVERAVEGFELSQDNYDLVPQNLDVAAQIDPISRARLCSTPTELREFVRNHNPNTPIVGMTPLQYRHEYIQQLPHVNHTAAAYGSKPYYEGFSGRIADIEVPVKRAATGGYLNVEHYSLVDLSMAPGRVYASAEKLFAAVTDGYTTYDNMTVAYGLFHETPDAPHPLAVDDPDLYEGQYDTELLDIFTDKDPFPSNSYGDASMTSSTGHTGEYIGMISETLDQVQPGSSAQFETPEYVKGTDEVMAAFGSLYAELKDISAEKARDSQLKLEDLLKKHLDKVKSRAGRDIANQWTNYLKNGHDPQQRLFDLRVPINAAIAMHNLRETEKKYGRRVPKDVKKAIAGERAHLRREFTQPLILTGGIRMLQRIKEATADEENPLYNPVRYTVTGIDLTDVQFAKLLGQKIRGGRYAATAASVSRTYGNFGPEARLIFDPSGDVNFERYTSIKHGERKLAGRGPAVIKNKDGMPVSAQHGPFFSEVVRSVYAHDKPLMMDGLVAAFALSGTGIQDPDGNETQRRHTVIDLFNAPGAILRSLDDMGAFGSEPQEALRGGDEPYKARSRLGRFRGGEPHTNPLALANLLGSIVEQEPRFALLRWDLTHKKYFVEEYFGEGEGVEIVATTNNSAVHTNKATVISTRRAEKLRDSQTGQSHPSHPFANIWNGGHDGPKFELAGHPRPENVKVLARFAILGSTVHASVEMDGEGAAQVIVMPSEPRPSDDELQRALDAKLAARQREIDI